MNPKLSVIAVFYNMRREASRTLFTLSVDYQREVSLPDYEIIVIDNGSSEPLGEEYVNGFGSNFKYYYLEENSKSPAKAVNFGVGESQGEFLACIVDGARMATPGLVHYSLKATQMLNNPFVSALTWHLGREVQNVSMLNGYDQKEEDHLLQRVNWREDGYQLFRVGVLGQSSAVGYLGGLPDECSYFMTSKECFIESGGFDEGFQSPGGGLCNHDFLNRIVQSCACNHVVLLGEGTFHQFHGGVATNVPLSDHPWEQFADEYRQLRGEPYRKFEQPLVHYMGSMPPIAIPFLNGKNSTLPNKETHSPSSSNGNGNGRPEPHREEISWPAT